MLAMKKVGADISYLVATLAGDSEQARINLRAHQVRDRFKRALETVYRDAAPLFLAHTNNVYIMNKEGFTPAGTQMVAEFSAAAAAFSS